ncbi:hypothetical protein GGS20DRAFT_244552 [Poronia punctata]|nr:hypothetical protein GGS20DRAFT_244552 [Poronia punctata]
MDPHHSASKKLTCIQSTPNVQYSTTGRLEPPIHLPNKPFVWRGSGTHSSAVERRIPVPKVIRSNRVGFNSPFKLFFSSSFPHCCQILLFFFFCHVLSESERCLNPPNRVKNNKRQKKGTHSSAVERRIPDPKVIRSNRVGFNPLSSCISLYLFFLFLFLF